MKKLMCLFAFGVSVAGATPISYTISGTGSGAIYAPGTEFSQVPLSTFANQSFTVNLFTNTSLIQALPSVGFIVPAAQGDVTLGSVSSVTTTPAWLFDVDSGGYAFFYFGIMQQAVDAVMNMEAPAFSSYGLSTTIGPFTVSAQTNPNQRFDAVIRSASGDIQFTDVSGVTFAADLPTTTPEPISFALLGMGMMAIGGWRKLAWRG
jgi:hypothetical protein